MAKSKKSGASGYKHRQVDHIYIRELVPNFKYSFYVIWDEVHKSPDGRKRSSTFKVEARDFSDAWRQASNLRTELERGSGDSVEAYVKRWWDAQTNFKGLDELTIEKKQYEIDRIIKYLGGYKMRKLTPSIVETCFSDMKETTPAYSLGRTFSTFKAICEKAFQEGEIDRNPCTTVPIGTPDTDQQKRAEKQLSPADCERFARELNDEVPSGHVVALWLGLATGMRPGEILGLKWKDVDFSEKTVKVSRSQNKKGKLKDTKSKRARTLLMDDATVAYLLAWKRLQYAELKMLGADQSGDTAICSGKANGSHISSPAHARWRRNYFVDHGFAEYENVTHTKTYKYGKNKGRTIVRGTGYRGPSSVSLRHASATLMLMNGVDIKTVQARLGHSRPTTALQHYIEETSAGQEKAAGVMGSIMSATEK